MCFVTVDFNLETAVVFVGFLHGEAMLYTLCHAVVSGRKSLCFPHLWLGFDSRPQG